jgi:hypothetical protein
MGGETAAMRALLVKLVSGDFCGEQVLAHSLGEVLNVDALGFELQEDRAGWRGFASEFPPRAERLGDTRRHLPPARVVGLVLVEPDDAVPEVEVLPGEPHGFCPAHALPVEEAVEDAVVERYLGASEEICVLRWE